jgi:endonuclease/exonuclease/phosphatase (EEP) superfamily protein YafD
MLGPAMIRRLVALVLVLAVAAALFVALWPQQLDLQRTWPVAQLVSFRGAAAAVAGALAVVLFVVAIAARPVRSLAASLGVLLLVFGAVSIGVAAARGLGREDFVEALPTDLTVVVWNTEGGAPGADVIAALAVEEGAEIVSLPETSAEVATAVADAMAVAGLPMTVKTVEYPEVDGSAATSLLIAAGLGEYTVAVAEDGTAVETTPLMPSVVATPVSGTGPVIVAAHPVAPTTSQMDPWNAGLSYLADACAGEDVIMAGDFNATLDHMSGLGTAGGVLGRCRDAGVTTANAGLGTWPTDLPPLLGTPIDHVLATRSWMPTGFKVVTDRDESGSDHRPVVAQLTLTGA